MRLPRKARIVYPVGAVLPGPPTDTPTRRTASPGRDGILAVRKRGVAAPRGHRGCGVGCVGKVVGRRRARA
eukprot:9628679-Lingulodinium_polyedra.AAC.1